MTKIEVLQINLRLGAARQRLHRVVLFSIGREIAYCLGRVGGTFHFSVKPIRSSILALLMFRKTKFRSLIGRAIINVKKRPDSSLQPCHSVPNSVTSSFSAYNCQCLGVKELAKERGTLMEDPVWDLP
jgi:hypothetical protein